MINNPLLLLSLFNSATNIAGDILEGAADVIGLTGNGKNGEGEGFIKGDFSSFLQQVNNQTGLDVDISEVSQEVAKLIDSEKTEQEISSFLNEKLTTSIEEGNLDESTKNAIEKILGGQNLSLQQEGENVNVNQNADQIATANQADPTSKDVANANNVTNTNNKEQVIINEDKVLNKKPLDVVANANNVTNTNNKEQVIINEDKVLNKKPLDVQEEIIKVDNKYTNPLNKNLGLKEDERLLGKDNLQSFTKGVDKEISQKNTEILGLKHEIVGKQVNVKNSGSENLTDLKLADAVKDQQTQQNNIFHKNDADHAIKQDHFAKTATNTRSQQTTYNQNDGNYRIVNFTKTQDGIELKLEPTSMGKVHIKFDFSPEGKPTIAVIAEKADTLEMLRNDSRAIGKILEDNGVKADSNSLSFNLQQGNSGSGGEQQKEFNFNNGRNIAFNVEQQLNDNVKDVSIASADALYKGATTAGMLNMVV